MITIESAETPLQLAFLAAQQLTFEDSQIHALRKVASLHGMSGTPDDLFAGLAVLEDARSLQLGLIRCHPSEIADEYPSFAVDFVALGRPDLADDVIAESIKIASGLSSKFRVATLAMVADVSHAIGETNRCMDVLRTIGPYIQQRKRFRSVEDSFATTLVLLHLKIGRVEVALSIAERMTGFEKANAFAELAFHGQPANQCRESYLGTAIRIATRKGYEYYIAIIAALLAKNGQCDRSKQLVAGIVKNYVRFEAMLDIAIHLSEAGRTTEAISILDQLGEGADTYYYYCSDHLKRLIPLLHEHRYVVREILDRIRAEAENESSAIERLLRITRMVGLVALYSRSEAEALVDLVLDAPLADLDRIEINPASSSNRASVCILNELLVAIAEHGLRFDIVRKLRFGVQLNSLS